MLRVTRSTGLMDRGLRGANVHGILQGLGAGIRRTSCIAEPRSANAILMTTPMISTPDAITMDARDSLQYALNFEPLHIHHGEPEGQISVGNARGLGILKQLGDLQQKITEIQAKVSSHDESISSNKQSIAYYDQTISSLKQSIATEKIEITDLQKKQRSQDDRITHNREAQELTKRTQGAQIQTLTSGNERYLRMRNRYISTYKRDFLRRNTRTDERIINAGNYTAHGGDAAVDATLYTMPQGRMDFSVFRRLYRVSPQTIEHLSE